MEKMTDFFARRVKGYDEHMINGVAGCKEAYKKMAELIPEGAEALLDLGCGTGLELENILKQNSISYQTLHHFSHTMKTELYKKICTSLKNGGIYIECDYMVETQEEEDHWFSENARIRRELDISEDVFYHYDTPCTVENQISMLLQAGFADVRKVFRIENTTIITARKEII